MIGEEDFQELAVIWMVVDISQVVVYSSMQRVSGELGLCNYGDSGS